jgi:hypothetical protein
MADPDILLEALFFNVLKLNSDILRYIALPDLNSIYSLNSIVKTSGADAS